MHSGDGPLLATHTLSVCRVLVRCLYRARTWARCSVQGQSLENGFSGEKCRQVLKHEAEGFDPHTRERDPVGPSVDLT